MVNPKACWVIVAMVALVLRWPWVAPCRADLPRGVGQHDSMGEAGAPAEGEPTAGTVPSQYNSTPSVFPIAFSTSPATGTPPAVPFFSWHRPWFLHSDPDDPLRHVGLGHPLQGTSWRNRPFYGGWMGGTLIGSPLIGGSIGQGQAPVGTVHLGWDFDHYWGTEFRYAISHLPLSTDAGRSLGTSQLKLWDLSLLYYPWGDARWRPYFQWGLGWSDTKYADQQLLSRRQRRWSMPMGGGVKYFVRPWMTARFSVLSNLSFERGELDTGSDVSISGGLEVRYGAPKRVYDYSHLWLAW